MAAALTAITDSVHFAHTDLVNWTLVADDNGVMLIDAGFPGNRDDVLASLRDSSASASTTCARSC